jgi:hypothetical protein
MVGVIVHWDNAAWINDPERIRTVMKFYTLTMKAFGLGRLDVITTDDIGWADTEIDFHTFPTLAACVAAHSGKTFVVLEKESNYPEETFTNIRDYTHPADDLMYVIGSDYSQVNLSDVPTPDLVTIDTPVSIALWSSVVLGIMLAERYNP